MTHSPKRYILPTIITIFAIVSLCFILRFHFSTNTVHQIQEPIIFTRELRKERRAVKQISKDSEPSLRQELKNEESVQPLFRLNKRAENDLKERVYSKIEENEQSDHRTEVKLSHYSSSEENSLKEYLRSSIKKVKPFNFSRCSLSNCFDFSICKSTGPARVFLVPRTEQPELNSVSLNETVGETNVLHKKIIKVIRGSKYFEPDPKKACIFVPEDDTLDRDPLSPSFSQNLNIVSLSNEDSNYGMNYLFFNLYSGSWPDYREEDFAGLRINAAMLAKASNSIAHHRPNFDISLPLFPHNHPISDKDLTEDWIKIFHSYYEKQNPRERTYFLTFKGKRYVYGSGSETRNSLYHLNNGRDVIMLTTCRHGKRWRQLSDRRCSEDELLYNKYDFVDLLKESTFCLIPRGRRLGSFRFLEAMSFGCIPVVLSDNWIPPFDDIIDWSSAIIQLKENMILQVPDILRDYDKASVELKRHNCLALYQRYFSTLERIIMTVLFSIEQRIKEQQSS